MLKHKNKVIPILEESFHHDGRGPELQRVIWGLKGVVLKGFEYYNPEDDYDELNIKHLELVKVEAFSQASDEVHGEIFISNVKDSKAAIFRIENSTWLPKFQQIHLSKCAHYQIMFYDEIFDVICQEIKVGKGRLKVE